MMSEKLFIEYCTGCGLCKTARCISFEENSKGFLVPLLSKNDIPFCIKVCPAGGNALNNYQDTTIWGSFKRCLLGWAANEKVREGSSSGGVLTALCCYLLDHRLVDGIIQSRQLPDDIRKVETIVSRTKTDVLSCMGSRYTASCPLMNLKELVRTGERYAFVGKPCDVSALRIFMEEEASEMKEQIIYLLSFFCAGQPSIDANNSLLNTLGGNDLDDCADLQYRGNGWPGFTTLTKKDGTKRQIDYETSWMKILGRDVRKICRFCADGTGELADIACGDAWYLGKNGRPDFTERPGRNIIFVRTDVGKNFLKEAINEGAIIAENFDIDKGQLKKMQPYHYTRKASLIEYKYALKVCGRAFPNYENNILRGFAKGFPLKQKILRFGGTIQRVIKGFI